MFRSERSNNARTVTTNSPSNEATKIINLSNKQLTNAEQKLSEKGF